MNIEKNCFSNLIDTEWDDVTQVDALAALGVSDFYAATVLLAETDDCRVLRYESASAKER